MNPPTLADAAPALPALALPALALPALALPALHIDLDTLLAPVPGDNPGGTGLRYAPVYQAIRQARTHDDASLPMGDWERPLVKADWKQVAALCGDALAGRSKDFQLAAWLCEAWTHLRGIEGFAAGTRVLAGLATHYWDTAYPKIEAGDTDARCAPFAWLNETLPMVLALHIPLLRLDEPDAAVVNLDVWERAANGSDGEDGLSREFLARRAGESANRAVLASAHRHLAEALPLWTDFGRLLDERLGADAPSLARVASALARLSRAVAALLGDAAVAAPAAKQPVAGTAPHGAGHADAPHDLPDDPCGQAVAPAAPGAPTAQAPAGGIASRAHAYRLLEEVADYLAQEEPHSPTPYLLRRAIGWGGMPLAELMRDILRDEGDVDRYLALLERR